MTRPTVPYSVVTDLSEKRKERAGLDKLGVLETPDADLIAERERIDHAWDACSVKKVARAKDLGPHVDRLALALETVQTELASIAVAVEPGSLPGSLIGLMGNSAEEIRRQLAPLREALNDGGGEAA